MSRGKFIVIEGIDGSGKTTQAHRLVEALQERGYPAIFTSECSHGPIGKLIRDPYLNGKRKADTKLIQILYAADRLDHITNEEDGMLLALSQGFNIICDRYYYSSMAYYASEFQESRWRKEIDFIFNLNGTARSLMKPDLTIYLDVAPKKALERINLARKDQTIEVFENKYRLEQIYYAYNEAIYIASKAGDDIIKLYGELHPDDVYASIVDQLQRKGIFTGLPEAGAF